MNSVISFARFGFTGAKIKFTIFSTGFDSTNTYYVEIIITCINNNNNNNNNNTHITSTLIFYKTMKPMPNRNFYTIKTDTKNML